MKQSDHNGLFHKPNENIYIQDAKLKTIRKTSFLAFNGTLHMYLNISWFTDVRNISIHRNLNRIESPDNLAMSFIQVTVNPKRLEKPNYRIATANTRNSFPHEKKIPSTHRIIYIFHIRFDCLA